MKNPPEKIYLQWHGDGESDDVDKVSESDVTWHRSRIYTHDIEYVQSDRIAELESELLARPTDEQFERIRNAEYTASQRIEELETQLASCEESRQNIGTERDNLDLALMQVQNENATLNAENTRLRMAINSIVRGTVKIEFIKATKPFYTITDNNICHCEENWEGAIDFLMTRVNALEA